MKCEDEKLKPPEARVGVCAGVHARVRARRVHKLSTRTERADGEDVDAHRLKSGACARFFAELTRRAALCCGEQTCRGDEWLFGRGERLWRAPTMQAGLGERSTNGTGLYKQLPGRQISGLRSCRGVEQ